MTTLPRGSSSATNVAFYGEGLDRLALASLCGHNIVTIAPEHPGAPTSRIGETWLK